MTTETKAGRFAALLSIDTRAAIASGSISSIKETNTPSALALKSIVSSPTAQAFVANKIKADGLISFPGAPATVELSELFDPTHTLDDSQVAALKGLCEHQYCCLTGAAGTGKTSLVKRVIANFIYGSEYNAPHGIRRLSGNQGPSVAVAAFTGKATSVVKKALPKWMHAGVNTIHGLLEFAPASTRPGYQDVPMFYPTRNAENPLDHDFIIVDEASMLGLNLWHQLIDACLPKTKIILMGDLNQLVPVADKPFFAYALAACLEQSEAWKVFELTTVHRQKGKGGQRILEAAYQVLDQQMPVFDKPADGSQWDADKLMSEEWYVMGIPLPVNTKQAHEKITKFMLAFKQTPNKFDPDGGMIYEPSRDMILTPGNGDDPSKASSLVQQAPLNETMSASLFPVKGDQHGGVRIGGRQFTRTFAVGDKIMARYNESPNIKNRVTNGTTGVVIDIQWNPAFTGDRSQYGTNKERRKHGEDLLDAVLNGRQDDNTAILDNMSMEELASFDLHRTVIDVKDDKRESNRPASHIVTVKYETEEVRTYDTELDIDRLQLAYYMTTQKAQGSQSNTVFIIVHQAASRRLNVEWLYTSLTRAVNRVVIFYTDQGLRVAVARQQIKGKTLAEKIKKYSESYISGDAIVRLYPMAA